VGIFCTVRVFCDVPATTAGTATEIPLPYCQLAGAEAMLWISRLLALQQWEPYSCVSSGNDDVASLQRGPIEPWQACSLTNSVTKKEGTAQLPRIHLQAKNALKLRADYQVLRRLYSCSQDKISQPFWLPRDSIIGHSSAHLYLELQSRETPWAS
jgi:hypothetical protein